jgi:drug/metabolite transporter (DMT)-like permease
MNKHSAGIQAALVSAAFMGMAPIFGKQAISQGFPPLAVVALRTTFASLLMLVTLLAFKPKYFYIYPAGLLGCFLAGSINGLGSLLYYEGLGRVNAGLGHLLYSLYPLFVAMWMLADRHTPSRLTVVRLLLIIPSIYLLTQANSEQIDMLGIAMMLGASALYALHLPINQRVLYDMPPPTVTLFTLLSMNIIVVPFFWMNGGTGNGTSGLLYQSSAGWLALVGLTLVTFLSRLLLFFGVKHLGPLQTAMLGLSEVLVTLLVAHGWLGESFSREQWLGAILMLLSLSLVGLEKIPPRRYTNGGWLGWLRPPGLQTDLPFSPHE